MARYRSDTHFIDVETEASRNRKRPASEPRALVMELGIAHLAFCAHTLGGLACPSATSPSLLIPVFQLLQETPPDANRAVGRTQGTVMGEDRIFSRTEESVSTPWTGGPLPGQILLSRAHWQGLTFPVNSLGV